MIKDRGTIKWTAMMLPEHVQEIRKLWESDKTVSERTIDEQQLELINLTIDHAITNQQLVKIIYYENGHYIKTMGHVKNIDTYQHKLSLFTVQEKTIRIDTHHIFEAELAE